MKKIIKLGIIFVLAYSLISGVSFAADTATSEKKEPPAESEIEKPLVPELKDMPPAPTLKEVAKKQKSDKEVLKMLADAPVAGPYDEHNRSTPRSSIIGFSLAVREQDYERAVNYLDLRNLPLSVVEEVDGPDLVKKLIIVAKRAMRIDFEDFSEDPLGHKDDGLPSYRDRITTLNTKRGPIDLYMQRVPRGDGVSIWKISNATVAMIPALDEEFGFGVIGNKLSQIFPHYVIMGLEVWQIFMMLCLLMIGYAIAFISTIVIVKILHINKNFKKERFQKFIVGPFRFLIVILFFRATFDMIAPSLVARALFDAKTFLIIALLWVMVGAIDLLINRLADRMKRSGQRDAVVLLKPAATAIKITIILVSVVSWMDNLGYQVTTILAGLGVGGVAFALGAQKSMENLIGSVTIYMSQPVRVGDFCKFGNTLGTVEEIGLRATQIRTLGRTVVHIPNAMFASKEIENLTQRDKILYRTRLRLSYKDTSEQIRQVLTKLRELIDQHEFIDEVNSRVRFLEFGEYAQELELYVYIKTMNFAEYLEHVEDVNLRINGIIESAGAHLTVPVKDINLNQPIESSST